MARTTLTELAEKVARLLATLGPDLGAALATTFDHKVARDPIRFRSSDSDGNDLLEKENLEKRALPPTLWSPSRPTLGASGSLKSTP